MKLWVLGSGSEGNAVLIEAGESRVLVDCGFGTRTLAGRLRTIGIAPGSIEACIVTHEHGDHIRGAAAGAAKWGWSLFASPGTIASWEELQAANCTSVQSGESIILSRMTVTTCATPHDATSPIGVRLTSTSSGACAVVCTDIGHASESVRNICKDADILVVESNYDEGMLRDGPYPPSVRARIASRVGHLSNRACADLVAGAVNRNLTQVVLAHLSQHCNDHGLAHRVMSETLRRTRFRGTTSVSMQHGVVGPFHPRAARVDAESQYALAL
ncbi:MAG: MBL fold metallo-hydrolase [Gemmatimonadota bacterium]